MSSARRILPRLVALCLCMMQVFVATAYAAEIDPAASGQTTSPAQDAVPPVPSQIAAAHTVFLSNLGGDTNFPIDSTEAYTAIYGELQAWGRYQLVSTPEQADLIFQLHDLSTYTTYVGNHGSTYTINRPSFQLYIVDPKSNVTLWTISSPVYVWGGKAARERARTIAETNLVSRIKVVAGQTLSATETADLTTVPKTHNKAIVFGLLGGFAVLSAGGYLLAHHLYEDGLADQKASQDAFCKANNIPLSQCAGG